VEIRAPLPRRLCSSGDGQPGTTPGNVKLLLPPRQSRGISQCIRATGFNRPTPSMQVPRLLVRTLTDRGLDNGYVKWHRWSGRRMRLVDGSASVASLRRRHPCLGACNRRNRASGRPSANLESTAPRPSAPVKVRHGDAPLLGHVQQKAPSRDGPCFVWTASTQKTGASGGSAPVELGRSLDGYV
jgi:hypothetical protein